MKEPKWNEKHNFVERRFLNDGFYHNSGHIIAKVVKEPHYLSTEFKIGNCDRSIFLDMDLDSQLDLNNSIHKLNQIIEVCNNYKNALEKTRPYLVNLDKWQKFKEEKRKNKEKDER